MLPLDGPVLREHRYQLGTNNPAHQTAAEGSDMGDPSRLAHLMRPFERLLPVPKISLPPAIEGDAVGSHLPTLLLQPGGFGACRLIQVRLLSDLRNSQRGYLSAGIDGAVAGTEKPCP